MTLHLLRLDPDPRAAARWFRAETLAAGEGDDEGYAWHALLSAGFGKDRAPKPFRLLVRRGREPQLLAYTLRDPAELEDAVRAFADPLVTEALGLAGGAPLLAKAMPPFAAGRRLGFAVTVRPTVRTDKDGDRTKSAEHDAYQAAVVAAARGGAPKPDRKAVYEAWMRERLAAGGAEVLDIRFDGLDRVKVARRDEGRRLRAVDGYAASLAGTLAVADAQAFAATLARGIGRHRAFGYGMLLLSPP